MRRGVRRALRVHAERQLGAERYSVTELEIRAAYFAAMRRLRKRWPQLDPADPRAEPAAPEANNNNKPPRSRPLG